MSNSGKNGLSNLPDLPCREILKVRRAPRIEYCQPIICLTERHNTNLTRRISNETQRYANHRVSALDPLRHVSPGGRHRLRDVTGKPLCGGHLRRLAVRARRTAIGVHHHAPRVALFVGRSEEHTSELQSLAYLVCRLL